LWVARVSPIEVIEEILNRVPVPRVEAT